MSTANRVSFETTSVAKTRAFGKKLARLLRPGDVVLLQGPLGAGKTALTQGIGQGLGLETDVTSPTFILVAAHPAAEGGVPEGARLCTTRTCTGSPIRSRFSSCTWRKRRRMACWSSSGQSARWRSCRTSTC